MSMCLQVYSGTIESEHEPIDWNRSLRLAFMGVSNATSKLRPKHSKNERKAIDRNWHTQTDNATSNSRTTTNSSKMCSEEYLPDIEDMGSYMPLCMKAINAKILGTIDGKPIKKNGETITDMLGGVYPAERTHPLNKERFFIYNNLRKIGYEKCTVNAHIERMATGVNRLNDMKLQDQKQALSAAYNSGRTMTPGCRYAINNGFCPFATPHVSMEKAKNLCAGETVGNGKRLTFHNPHNVFLYNLRKRPKKQPS